MEAATSAEPAVFEIRTAADNDFSAILDIMRSTPWEKTAYLQWQLALGNILVACEDTGVRGFIVCNREFFWLPFVWLVAVDPAYRKRGIASQLYAHVESQCAGLRLYSSTNETNTAMQRFFERRGYRRAGVVDVDPGDAEVFYCIDL